MALSIVILAAGQGKRMRSALPKVLHPLAGKPLLSHVIDAAKELEPERIVVVVGHGGETVRERLADHNVRWVSQDRQLGTGHAVQQALPSIPADHRVLILYGDVPLIDPATVGALADSADEQTLALLSVDLADPTGYGRIVRDADGHVAEIVEHKDASPEQLRIVESNTGIMAAVAGRLAELLDAVGCDNAQGEYYLTDTVRIGRDRNMTVVCRKAPGEAEVTGVNSRSQLAELERIHQRSIAERLMDSGVSLIDPARIDVRGKLSSGPDTEIDVGCVFIGQVQLGERVRVGPYCVLRDCVIGDDVELKPFTSIEESNVGARATLGPYARVRPGCELAESVHIGNFVELKKAAVGPGSKVNHLTYVGDARIGKAVNVGAGTITCNYDGANKHLTVIEDGAFIGSNASLVAPVTVGQGATIGAGTVLSKNAPANGLTVARARQVNIENWQRPVKAKT